MLFNKYAEMPTFPPGKGRQLEVGQTLSTHPQTLQWRLEDLSWPPWAPGASQVIAHLPTAQASNEQGQVLR